MPWFSIEDAKSLTHVKTTPIKNLTKGRIKGKGIISKEKGSRTLPAKGTISQLIIILKG